MAHQGKGVEPAARPRSSRRLVASSLRALAKAIRDLRAHSDVAPGDEKGAARVHALRVASRRAGVMLAAHAPPPPAKAWRRARRLARRLRRVAGTMRECDVHRALFSSLLRHDAGPVPPAATFALEHIEREWIIARDHLRSALHETSDEEVARAARHVDRSMRDARDGALERARAHLLHLAQATVDAAGADLTNPVRLHDLRLTIKRLRYAIELLAPSLDESAWARVLPDLEAAQRVFGDANDVATLVDRLDRAIVELRSVHPREAAGAPSLADLRTLRDRFAQVRDRRYERAAAWWAAAGLGPVLRALVPEAADASADTPPPAPPVTANHDAESHTTEPTMSADTPGNGHAGTPHGSNGAGLRAGVASLAPQIPVEVAGHASPTIEPAQRSLFLSGRRLGVIDIGSNSIRLLAVELADERTWKVLGEERAMTRLAQGLARGGGLSPDAMARSVEAIGRFLAIAERLGCASVRAFATAAVREAGNRADFESLVKDRTGLTLELVSELDEGKLTFRSVARVIDLTHGTSAVADIGGGSLEVVQATDEVITSNTSMPLGAVRLTEAFGGADACAGHRYKEMRKAIARQIARRVRVPSAPPAVLVGCGGTFTTLLTLGAASRGVLLDRASPALATLGPVSLAQTRGMIETLRGLSLEERLRVPGLPSDRADIVIAGFTVIERLMTHLGVTQVHVHPGGFREGLLLRMIDDDLAEQDRASQNASDEDHMRWVRAFAQRCRYERAHSEQVARLALRLYDQFREESDLIPGLGSARHERLLLEAASVLHDIGMLVEYRSHHKHSRTIIRHADLRGFTPREIDLIALIARYHRRAAPRTRHAGFAALGEPDRALVRRLAAILRVADGLDRAHAQNTTDVRVRFGRGEITLEVDGVADTGADIDAADEKSDLLRAVLGVKLSIAPATATP